MSSAPLPAFRALTAKTTSPAYEPSYDLAGDGDRLGDAHARAGQLVADVPGWLRPEDALKLYELAFFARGPILEMARTEASPARSWRWPYATPPARASS